MQNIITYLSHTDSEETKDYGSIKTEKPESAPNANGGGERFGFKSLFDTRVMLKHSCIMQVGRVKSRYGMGEMFPIRILFLDRFFNWMVVALSYYGISYSAGSIGDDLFVSNILIALVGKKSHTKAVAIA